MGISVGVVVGGAVVVVGALAATAIVIKRKRAEQRDVPVKVAGMSADAGPPAGHRRGSSDKPPAVVATIANPAANRRTGGQ